MSRFWTEVVHRLTPYIPGEQPQLRNPVKLNTNENPYPPSPRVREAIMTEMGTNADILRRYPDPKARSLRESIARYHGLDPQQVFVGNGSDEVLAHLFPALLKGTRSILFPDITYSFYPVYCRLYKVKFRAVALDCDFSIRVADYIAPNGGILIPNPNAPTGRALTLAQIEIVLQANPNSVVAIDEAYVDFGAESAIGLINSYANLIVIQTLSKARSLAGMRIGLAFGQSELIEGLERVKDSFNSYPVDRLAQVAAIAAYEDDEWFQNTRAKVIASRTSLEKQLTLLGFKVIPSAANFLFVAHPRYDAAELASALREREIFVRHFEQPRIEQYLRISVGTEQECGALIRGLQEILSRSESKAAE